MGIKDKNRRNEYERRKWKERRDAKLLAMGIDPATMPIGGDSGHRGPVISVSEKTLPASIRLKRPEESDEEYRKRYGRERINHWNARNREHVAERARKNYQENHEEYKSTKKAWVKNNPGSIQKFQKKYYDNNKAARNQKAKQWKLDNPERARENSRRWQRENPEVFQASTAKCRAQILKAAPEWTDWKAIRKIYQKSANHNRDHPTDLWQVDHIIPLNHRDVCGLHVPCNLRIISKAKNQIKGNRWLQEEGVAPML